MIWSTENGAGRQMMFTCIPTCLLISTFFFATARAQGCTFPSDLDGVFDSSHETLPLTFNSTHVYPFTVDTQSLQFSGLVFECHVMNDSYYIARSADSFDIYTVPYYVYTCWEFSKQTSDRYVQYQATTKLSSASDRNYKIYPIAFPIDHNVVCDVTKPYTGDSISVLVKNGTALSARVNCPTAMWGKFVYQLTSTSGSTHCNYNSWLDLCSSTSIVAVNTTLCTDITLYSSGGTLYCMNSFQDTSVSDTYYVHLYNDDATVDSTTTYRFTCLVLHYTSTVTYMTQYPGDCLDSASQNATYITTSPGGLYTMYANVTCPPETDSSDNTAIIVAVVVILLLLIIAGIIGGIYYYYYRVYLPKKRALSSKISPDGLPESAMTADKNYRMMFTPGPPKSAVPPREWGAGYPGQLAADTGSRAVSSLTVHPTVSALAGYRTPSPYVTEGNNVDVDSLLDYDLSPKQALGEPDGEESGVMLEMDGSLPLYSEAGDTPEPTRRTPLGTERN